MGARTHIITIEIHQDVALGRVQTAHVARLRSNADSYLHVTADIDDMFPYGLSQDNSEGWYCCSRGRSR